VRWLAMSTAERELMSARARATFTARYDMRRNSAAILNVFAKVSSSKEDA
jgi:hypothetical protein